ncbi:MAG: T9SS type A sorting domain-containing protein [Bacteroidota bacterium]
MKQLKLLLIVFVASAFTCSAQLMPIHVISAGGGNYQSAAAHISWTIGQSGPVASTYQPTVIFHGGFQQYLTSPVSVPEMKKEEAILLYPNPCTDQIVMDIMLDRPSEISYQLYDAGARLVLNESVQGVTNNFNKLLDLGSLSPGIYNLKLMIKDDSSWSIQSLKIIKQ